MVKLFSYLQESHGISRREYMQMLKEQAIFIGEKPVDSMNAEANLGDTIDIYSKGKLLFSETIRERRRKQRMIVLFNKPKGYTVSKEDKHNKTIYELLPKSRHKDFYYIGRLDKDSHGLLLLTNDPALVDLYERPENNVYKVYEVEIDQPMKTQHVQKAKKGIVVDEQGNTIEGPKPIGDKQTAELLKVVSMTYKPVKQKHYVIIMLNEGKKRHIRRLLKGLGYRVKDLKRIKVGKYQLGTIKPGKYMIQKYKQGKNETS